MSDALVGTKQTNQKENYALTRQNQGPFITIESQRKVKKQQADLTSFSHLDSLTLPHFQQQNTQNRLC